MCVCERQIASEVDMDVLGHFFKKIRMPPPPLLLLLFVFDGGDDSKGSFFSLFFPREEGGEDKKVYFRPQGVKREEGEGGA